MGYNNSGMFLIVVRCQWHLYILNIVHYTRSYCQNSMLAQNIWAILCVRLEWYIISRVTTNKWYYHLNWFVCGSEFFYFTSQPIIPLYLMSYIVPMSLSCMSSTFSLGSNVSTVGRRLYCANAFLSYSMVQYSSSSLSCLCCM